VENNYEENLKEILQRIDEFKDFLDVDRKDLIIDGLIKRKQKTGEFYCPCKLECSADNICPCIEFRTTGNCHCGMFKRKYVSCK
jgi:ferredoxin-thioredoxin reductase catalytic subunit